MFGWRMEEEAKLEFTITVNWCREDGSIAMTQLATLDRGACRSAEDVGLQLADAKPILGRLQEIVVSEQVQRYCEAVRPCPRCHRRRHLSQEILACRKPLVRRYNSRMFYITSLTQAPMHSTSLSTSKALFA